MFERFRKLTRWIAFAKKTRDVRECARIPACATFLRRLPETDPSQHPTEAAAQAATFHAEAHRRQDKPQLSR